MQVTKTTEEPIERSLVPFKEQVREIPQKVGSFFKNNRKRALIVAASVFVIVAAIGINWILFGQSDVRAGQVNTDKEKTEDENRLPAGTDSENENPKSFFALAVTDRQRARDEAIEVLQTVVDSADASGEEKSAAAASISKIASYIQAEANIETLVKSKGFEECVAVVSDDAVSVVVGTDSTLMANELAQIKEIIYLQTSIDPSAMRISEKIIPSAASPSGTAAQETAE